MLFYCVSFRRCSLLVCSLITVLGMALRSDAAIGDIDASFAQQAKPDEQVTDVLRLPNGQLLVSGYFSKMGSVARRRLARLHPDGQVDLTFDTRQGPDGAIYCMAAAADGMVYIGGMFEKTMGLQSSFGRIRVDGTLDESFRPVGMLQVQHLVVQPNGAIVVAGYSSVVSKRVIQRFNSDGTVDSQFAGPVVLDAQATALALQNDGKILVGGNFNAVHGVTRKGIARLNADGTLDPTFDPGEILTGGDVRTVVVMSDGQILVGGGDFPDPGGSRPPVVLKLSATGGLNEQLAKVGSGSTATCLALQEDGGLLVGGAIEAVSGVNGHGIVRLLPDGSIDASFPLSIDELVRMIAVQADGKLLLGGDIEGCVQRYEFENISRTLSAPQPDVLRLERSATGEHSEVVVFEFWGATGNKTYLSPEKVAADRWEWHGDLPEAVGTVVATSKTRSGIEVDLLEIGAVFPEIVVQHPLAADVGSGSGSIEYGQVLNGASRTEVIYIRNNGPGVLRDLSATLTGANAADFVVVRQPPALIEPGDLVSIGVRMVGAGSGVRQATLHIVSNDPDEGDISVMLQGAVQDAVPSVNFGVEPQTSMVADTYIAAGKQLGNLTFASPAGTVPPLSVTVVEILGGDPIVGHFANLPEGAYVTTQVGSETYRYQASYLGGSGNDMVLQRVATGSVDTAVPIGNSLAPRVVAIQPDGKILMDGQVPLPGGGTRYGLMRRERSGLLDTTFESGALTEGREISQIAVLDDGRIVVVGNFTTYDGLDRGYIAVLLPNGQVDPSFAYTSSLYLPNALAIDRDGYIVFSYLGSANTGKLARISPAGSVVNTYNSVAYSGNIFSIAPEASGGLIVGGLFQYGTSKRNIGRVLTSGGFDPSFTPASISYPISVAIQRDDKILVRQGSGVVRLTASGALEKTYSNTGFYGQSMSLQANGDVVFDGIWTIVSPLGTFSVANMVQLMPETSGIRYLAVRDLFGQISSNTLLPWGRMLVGGSFSSFNSIARGNLAVLHGDPAIDVISIPTSGTVRWRRGGGAPEAQYVKFDLSTDGGTNWSPVGLGTRVAGGWEVSGQSLPASGLIRGRARIAGGQGNTSSGIHETMLSYDMAQPEVVLEESVDGDLVSGVSAVNFGSTVVGAPVTKTFTVRNTNQGLLAQVAAQVSGFSQSDFSVQERPASQVAGGGSTTFTIKYTPQGTGTSVASLTLGSNDPDEGAFVVTLRGTGISVQQGWRQTHFGTTFSSGNAADLFDFDGDGLPNVLEYAFGLHPKQNSAGQTPQAFLEGEYLVIRFTAPAGVAGVTYGAVASPDLSANSWTPVSDSGVGAVHEFKVPTTNGGRRFMKLTVTAP